MKVKRNKKNESGFTLLEYCAGAAVITGAVYLGFNALGVELGAFFDAISSWASDRTGQITTPPTP